LALLCVQHLPGRRFFRVVFLLPMMITSKGPFYPIWNMLGLANTSWANDAWGARAAVMIGDIWQWTPFMFIVLLAVPEGQSVEQVEAATLDGVSMGLWAFVILFPLYWILITSVKLTIDVNNGPFYLPFVDSQPSDYAWKYIFLICATIPCDRT
jgi:multiple sugar transport system permease protein